ncbi:hypothetical protein WN48_05487 [Eufriesea mexicana]|uniref:Uncharacterized protein n=1 Tax=Eufriesea mexicana TaxID=516756 RepID=A0A310S441_9HYME|nr:hypothetical protein WN48_05487 [Eufriesea mexicana]
MAKRTWRRKGSRGRNHERQGSAGEVGFEVQEQREEANKEAVGRPSGYSQILVGHVKRKVFHSRLVAIYTDGTVLCSMTNDSRTEVFASVLTTRESRKVNKIEGKRRKQHANLIIGARHPCASRTGKRRFPTIDPILPTSITRLTAIVLVSKENPDLALVDYACDLLFARFYLKEVGNKITVAATLMLRVVFINPMIKLASSNVISVLDDQFM